MVDKPEFLNGISVPYGATVAQLSTMIASSTTEKWAAFLALAHSNSAEALDVLAKATQSSDPYTRRAAVEAIGRHSQGDTLGQLVCQGLRDSSEYVVRTACEAAASLQLDDAHDQVLGLTNDGSPATRWAAVRSLKLLWRPSDFTRLFQLAQDDQDAKVRKEAAWTLREHASRENWRLLFDAWREGSPSRHRVWACELAERFGGSEAVSLLEKLIADRDGHVREAARRAISIVQERVAS